MTQRKARNYTYLIDKGGRNPLFFHKETLKLLDVHAKPARIFNVGLPKTGTTSFEDAMLNYGFKVSKGGQGGAWYKHLWLNRSFPNKFHEYHCHSNFAEWHHKRLAREFPNSHFVYTTRNMDKWLVSIEKQLERDKEIHYHYNKFADTYFRLYIDIFKSVTFERNKFIELWEQHHEYVLEDKSINCLLIDLEDKNKEIKLAEFIGAKEVTKYPHKHKTQELD